MKKILTFVLVVAMMLTLTVSVYAETVTGDALPLTSQNQTINIVIATAADVYVDTYSVDVNWVTPTLTYTQTTTKTWNPGTHDWDAVTEGEWGTFDVIVTNHSSQGVTATINLPAETNGVTLTSKVGGTAANSFTLATAVGTTVAEAPTNTFTIGATGTPDPLQDFTVTATVSISAAP